MSRAPGDGEHLRLLGREVRHLDWQPTGHAHRLLAVGGVALGAGVLLGRPLLVAAATPFLVLLGFGLSARRPREVAVWAEFPEERCIEGQPIDVAVTVECDPPVDRIEVRVPVPVEGGFESRAPSLEGADQGTVDASRRHTHAEGLVPQRWGRWTIGPARVRLITGAGALSATVLVPIGQLAVYPRASAERPTLGVGRQPNRAGDHASRSLGSGIEFAGITEHVAGMPQRRVNWAVSSRRGQLHVNQFAAERAIDLVLAIDAFSDVGEQGETSLDISLRGVVGLANAYLRQHDRVGVVAIGGILRWLGPDVGVRQLYRVADQLLSVRLDSSFVDPDLERIPQSALPPGALVVLFSPLLDPRAPEAARELRERGHPVVIVDVLTTEPVPGRRNRLGEPALRLWRLDRVALRRELGQAGIAVVSWDGREQLDAVLAPLARLPLAARSS